MPRETRTITEADILSHTEWAKIRKDHRKALSERKKNRRVAIGPHAVLLFENWDTMWYPISIGGDRVKAVAETDLDRTTADGKTSSVHFLHFAFTLSQIAAFRAGGDILVRIDHPSYGHAAILSDAVREELAGDFA